MQLKLNNHEIQQALKEFLQKRHSIGIEVTSFDLKGMRSEEGYYANVEIEYEDVPYDRTNTSTTKVVKESVESNEPSKEITKFTSEELVVIQEINTLLMNNVMNRFGKEIVEKVNASTEAVQQHFKENAVYMSVIENFSNDADIDDDVPPFDVEEKPVTRALFK